MGNSIGAQANQGIDPVPAARARGEAQEQGLCEGHPCPGLPPSIVPA